MLISEKRLKEIIRRSLFSESRFVMSDLSDTDENDKLSASNMSKEVGSQIDFKTFKSNRKFKDFLKNIAGPNVFISFIDPYEKDENDGSMKIPSFSLNPKATFNTPHGIYAYPFDKQNFKNFIITKSPTKSKFATERPYFHLIKIDLNNPNVFVFNEKGKCNKHISKIDFKNQLKELVRIHCYYFNKENTSEVDEIFNNFLNEYDSASKRVLMNVNKDYYYQLYKAALKLCNEKINFTFMKTTPNTKHHSELYALLLNRIGMKCVIDRGSGTIHENEPSQMHILTFGEDKSFYKYIGTYKNEIKITTKDLIENIDMLQEGHIIEIYKNMGKNAFNKDIIHLIFKELFRKEKERKSSTYDIPEYYFLKELVREIYNKLSIFYTKDERHEAIKDLFLPEHIEFMNLIKYDNDFGVYSQKILDILKAHDESYDKDQNKSVKELLAIMFKKGKEYTKYIFKNTDVLRKYTFADFLQEISTMDFEKVLFFYDIILNFESFNEEKVGRNGVKNIESVYEVLQKFNDRHRFPQLLHVIPRKILTAYKDEFQSFIRKNLNNLYVIDELYNELQKRYTNPNSALAKMEKNFLLKYIKDLMHSKN